MQNTKSTKRNIFDSIDDDLRLLHEDNKTKHHKKGGPLES